MHTLNFRTNSILLLLSVSFPGFLYSQETQTAPTSITPVPPLSRVFDTPQAAQNLQQTSPELIEALSFIRITEARNSFREQGKFELSGEGITIAVLDTGLRTTHVDFKDRILTQRNYTQENNGDINNASDGHGHGTHVSGIIAAGGINTGVAPAAKLIPIKVLDNNGDGSFDSIRKALEWINDKHSQFGITVVNLSLSDSNNYINDNFGDDAIGNLISELRNKNIAVVAASGNNFYTHRSAQGMGYPAIFKDSVSVGAVYDSNAGGFGYENRAATKSSAPGQITPFSQRLHETIAPHHRTDIFAPGAPITSSGHTTDRSISTQAGTSQASPMTAGMIALMQQYYIYRKGQLPTIKQLEEWLRAGGVTITDNYGDIDNVTNTNMSFTRLDALDTIQTIKDATE